jgi:hypothetical protein
MQNSQNECLDLVTANKQMSAILEMFQAAEPGEFVMFDQQFQSIANKAAQVAQILNNAKGN